MNQPIVVDKQGVIIVGHGRYEALKLRGIELTSDMIKVVDLTEAQARAYRLADNKLNESDWDMDLVIEELGHLSEVDELLARVTGFDPLLLDGEFNFQNKELDAVAIEKQAAEHATKPCPNCGYEF
jgi:site-specific DNA-methyltransferase (adenine-specific)